ncbi:MAG: hypothetical protein SFX73_26205 [Kofleriaceae bacterium]|nr:hypothetical protein [Kofleriaceae bacterium]
MKTLAGVLLTSLAVGSFHAGCMSDEEDEDLVIEDGDKADGFGAPVSHGWLSFDGWAGGQVKANYKFHAWTFQLSGDAEVDLTTQDSDVDTVMYVYRRNSTTGRWGYPIWRNDDANGDVTSALNRNYGEGVYRVLVKSKDPTGTISLTSSCSGDGCPSEQAMCRFDNIPAAPAATGLTQGCLREIDRVVNGEAAAHTSETASLATRGALTSWERRGLEIVAREECATDLFQEFSMTSHQTIPNQSGTGALVSFDTDPDSGYTSWVALAHGGAPLVTLKWLHDSATYTWTCPADFTPALEPQVDEYCVANLLMMGSINANVDDVELGSQAGGEGGAAVPQLVKTVVAWHRGSSTAAPTFTYRAWSTDHGDAAKISIATNGGGVTYVAGDRNGAVQVMARFDSTAAKLLCAELP